jgi:hypothetical protein
MDIDTLTRRSHEAAAEAWKVDHVDAMHACDAQDLAARAIGIQEAARDALFTDLARDICAGKLPTREMWRDVNLYAAAWRSLFELCRRAIRIAKANGYTIDNQRDLYRVAVEVEQWAASYEEMKRLAAPPNPADFVDGDSLPRR